MARAPGGASSDDRFEELHPRRRVARGLDRRRGARPGGRAGARAGRRRRRPGGGARQGGDGRLRQGPLQDRRSAQDAAAGHLRGAHRQRPAVRRRTWPVHVLPGRPGRDEVATQPDPGTRRGTADHRFRHAAARAGDQAGRRQRQAGDGGVRRPELRLLQAAACRPAQARRRHHLHLPDGLPGGRLRVQGAQGAVCARQGARVERPAAEQPLAGQRRHLRHLAGQGARAGAEARHHRHPGAVLRQRQAADGLFAARALQPDAGRTRVQAKRSGEQTGARAATAAPCPSATAARCVPAAGCGRPAGRLRRPTPRTGPRAPGR